MCGGVVWHCRYNGTAGPTGLLRGDMTAPEVSQALVAAVFVQVNRDLNRTQSLASAAAAAAAVPVDGGSNDVGTEAAGEGGTRHISQLLGEGRGEDGVPVQISAYISCVQCVRSEVHAVDDHVPLLVSDVLRMT